MLINPFLIVLIVILRCCKKDSSAINLTFSEQLLFSYIWLVSVWSKIKIYPKHKVENVVIILFENDNKIIAILKYERSTTLLKNVNNCLNTNIYSHWEISGGQGSHLYLNDVHFFLQQC